MANAFPTVAAIGVDNERAIGLSPVQGTHSPKQIFDDVQRLLPIVSSPAPVNGTTIAYYVGQQYTNSSDGSRYYATAKSTAPLTSGAGSAWALLPSGIASVRQLGSASTPSQAQLQALYDGQLGSNAPDTVPAQVVTAAGAINTTQYKVYLGHNIWSYTNVAVPNGTTDWIAFNSSKSNFGAGIQQIFTFK
jgi:hypothetical protein